MATFPSSEWFEQLTQRAVARSEELGTLGFSNIKIAFQINTDEGPKAYGLILEGFDITYAGEVDPDTWDSDCIFEGPIVVWEQMLTNIRDHGYADGLHTLNALSLAEEPMRVSSGDPMGRDLFYRFNQTLQEIIDLAGEVPTEMPIPT